jgi:hypothetical protein
MKTNILPTKPSLKTLLLTGGIKGGTGKTLGMVGFADWLAVNGRAFTPLDCDHENRGKVSSFANVFPEGTVGRPDLRTEDACDKLLYTTAESETGLVLADLPANSGADFLTWWANVCTPENLAELNVRVIMIGVITPEPATFAGVSDWAKVMQGSVSYVMALNRRHHARATEPIEELMPDYFASETGRRFRAAFNPVELEIPAMQEKAMAAMLRSGRLPSFVSDIETIPGLDRTRIRCWINQLHSNLNAANETLHLLN